LIREDIETLLGETDALIEVIQQTTVNSSDLSSLFDHLYVLEMKIHRGLRGSAVSDCWCDHCQGRRK
jgi:hypothetical protein